MLVYNDGGVTNLRPKKFHLCCARWCFYSKSLSQFLLIPMYTDPQIPTSMKFVQAADRRTTTGTTSFFFLYCEATAICDSLMCVSFSSCEATPICVSLLCDFFFIAKQRLFALHFCVFSLLYYCESATICLSLLCVSFFCYCRKIADLLHLRYPSLISNYKLYFL